MASPAQPFTDALYCEWSDLTLTYVGHILRRRTTILFGSCSHEDGQQTDKHTHDGAN